LLIYKNEYGIGSIKFRWSLSGSYQQVIPSYVSIDQTGKKINFLENYFNNLKEMSKAIFNKGYQWPFDSRKVKNGSSIIDYALYIEKNIKHRKIYLDFTKNIFYKDKIFNIKDIDISAYNYLKNSKALQDTPIKRLKKLNLKSYELFKKHKIDLSNDLLEIDLLPQHNNGGASVNKWWETSIKHIFSIGECAGTHGIYRPGGAALNSGQVGGLRASYYIKNIYHNKEKKIDTKKVKILINSYALNFTKQNNNLIEDRIDFIK